jgi:hypothetical protein
MLPLDMVVSFHIMTLRTGVAIWFAARGGINRFVNDNRENETTTEDEENIVLLPADSDGTLQRTCFESRNRLFYNSRPLGLRPWTTHRGRARVKVVFF